MGSKGGGGTNTVTSSAPPEEVLANYKEVTDQAKQVAATPYTPYGGQLVAGLNPTQNSAIQGIQNSQGAYNPYAQAAQGYISQGTNQITPSQFSTSAVQQYENPFQQDVINSTMAQINQQNQMQQQQLTGNAISKGAWGGDRAAIAQSSLAGQQALASNSTLANLNSQNYSQALGEFNTQQQAGLAAQQQNASNSLQGAGLTGALGNYAYQNQMSGLGAQLNAGSLQQQTSQNDLNAQYQQFQQQQAYPFNTTQWLSGITSGLGSQMGGTTSTQSPAPNAASGMLSGALSGGSLGYMLAPALGFGAASGAGVGALAGLLLSDKRAKEDINKVGKLDNGLPVYTFKYKGDNTTHMGLMAQDVEKKNPDAVHDVNGLKAVDYDSASYADGGTIDYSRSWVPDEQIAHNPVIFPTAATPAAQGDGGMGAGLGALGMLAKQPGGMPGMGQDIAFDMNKAGFGNQAYNMLENIDAVAGMASGGVALADLNDRFDLSQTSGGNQPYIPGFGETVTNPMAVQTKLMERGYADGGFTPAPGQQDPMQEFFSAKQNFALQHPDLVSPVNSSPMSVAGADPNNNFGSMINGISSGGIDNPQQSSLPSTLPPSLLQKSAAAQGQSGQPAIDPPALAGLQQQLAQNAPKLDPAMAALAAGAEMMGGTSPYARVNIGKGIAAGLQNYTQQQGTVREYALKQAEVEKQAQQLAMEAARYNKQLDIEQQNADTNKGYKDVMAGAAKQNADTKTREGGGDFSKYFKDPDRTEEALSNGKIEEGDLTPEVNAKVDRLLAGGNPSAISNRKDLRDDYTTLAKLKDPSYDEADYATRAAALKAYNANGNVGKEFASFNTILQHGPMAIQQAQELNNQGVWTPGNKLLNVIKSNTGDPRVKVLQDTINTLASEKAKMLNASGVVTDAAREESQMEAFDSLEQLKKEIINTINQTGARASVRQQQFLQDTNGQDSDYLKKKADTFIQPATREQLNKLGIPIKNFYGSDNNSIDKMSPEKFGLSASDLSSKEGKFFRYGGNRYQILNGNIVSAGQ